MQIYFGTFRLRDLFCLHKKRFCKKKRMIMKTKYKLTELIEFFDNYGRANRKDKRKMADAFGLGITAASRIAGYLGISASRHVVDKAEIARMLSSGRSVKDISAEMRVSKGVVYKQIKRGKGKK